MDKNVSLYSVDDPLHVPRIAVEQLGALLYRETVNEARVSYLPVAFAVEKFVDDVAYLAVCVLTVLHAKSSHTARPRTE